MILFKFSDDPTNFACFARSGGRLRAADSFLRPASQLATGTLHAKPNLQNYRHTTLRAPLGLPDRAAAEGADVAGEDPPSPRGPAVLDHARHDFETALRSPFENDAGYGPHLPDLGAPAIPNTLLDRLRQPGAT